MTEDEEWWTKKKEWEVGIYLRKVNSAGQTSMPYEKAIKSFYAQREAWDFFNKSIDMQLDEAKPKDIWGLM